MSLCQYKDIFGKPGVDLHSYRLFGVAIVDVIFTIMLGLFISQRYEYQLSNVLVILFIMGIIAHRIFCVETAVDKILFKKKWFIIYLPSYSGSALLRQKADKAKAEAKAKVAEVAKAKAKAKAKAEAKVETPIVDEEFALEF